VRVSEWVSFVYFAYLFAVALIKGSWPGRLRAVATSGLYALVVVGVALLPDTAYTITARDWIPGGYLLAGYWLSGLFFVKPMLRIEERCLTLDLRLFERLNVPAVIERAPRIPLEVLELAYVACFLFVPACVAMVILTEPALADRSWTLVLLGEFGAFGMLPWVQTRPPRVLEAPGPLDKRPLLMRGLNRFMVRNTSIQVNTLPSGHVAGSLTAAIALWPALPRAGFVALAIAGAITVSAVVGRYHYAIDAVSGVGVALIAWALVGYLF
jgi:hypothetical protein